MPISGEADLSGKTRREGPSRRLLPDLSGQATQELRSCSFLPDLSAGRLAEMTRTMTFTATAQARPRGGIAIVLPFDLAEAWGDRDRYYLAGTIEQYSMRATVTPDDGDPMLALGPAWCRDPRVGPGASLRVSLHPEGPQLDTMSSDLADALRAEPDAQRFFESLATFYRNAFVTWVEGAKRPETRARHRRGGREPQGRPSRAIGPLVEPWLVILLIVGGLGIITAIAWDTAKSGTAGGVAYRAGRKRSAAEADERERLHRLTHPDE